MRGIIPKSRFFLNSTLLTLVLTLASFSFNIPLRSPAVQLVVIDPGHGGKDPGCSFQKYQEKNIALSISKKLGSYIQSNFPGTQVIYTRETDVFVPLFNRAKIANDLNADLFISVHCNSFKDAGVKGTETFVLGAHDQSENEIISAENLAVAQRENQSILLEENYLEQYNGFDPNSPLSHIIFSMYQDAFLEQSLVFAEQVETYFKKNAGRPSRGVKQAGFIVLKETTMPSVLVEAGFLSNQEDRALLISKEGQDQLAYSIFKAFLNYSEDLEKSNEEQLIRNLEPVIPNFEVNPPPAKSQEYKILLKTSSSMEKLEEKPWNLVRNLSWSKEGDKYRYYSNTFSEQSRAEEELKYLRINGFPDALIISNGSSPPIPSEKTEELITPIPKGTPPF